MANKDFLASVEKFLTDGLHESLVEEIRKFNEMENPSPTEIWKLNQKVFKLLKKAGSSERKANEAKLASKLSVADWRDARQRFRDAKEALEEATANLPDEVKEDCENQNAVIMLRKREQKIFQGLFNMTAVLAEKHPAQIPLQLFVEQENPAADKLFGAFFRYELKTQGKGSIIRGRTGSMEELMFEKNLSQLSITNPKQS